MKNLLLPSVLMLMIVAQLARAAPLDPARRSSSIVPPCPESYQPCCTEFNGICNVGILRRLTGLELRQNVAVLLPDSMVDGSRGDIGYYAHVLAKLVGRGGHVYTVTPPEIAATANSRSDLVDALELKGGHADSNVTQLVMPFAKLPSLPKLDLVWVIMDVYQPLDFFKPLRAPSFLPVFEALQPNGRFILADSDTQKHCGPPSPNCTDPGPILLHGERHEKVLHEIQQAGFELKLETRALHDPTDPLPGPCCAHGSFADGTTWRSFPFLWVFQHRPH